MIMVQPTIHPTPQTASLVWNSLGSGQGTTGGSFFKFICMCNVHCVIWQGLLHLAHGVSASVCLVNVVMQVL
jgi:hypothetical protein